MGIIRGDLAIAAAPGDYGKPRPVLVLQSDAFHETASLIVALITTDQRPSAALFRKSILPSDQNGLREPSDVMIDKLVTLPRSKVGKIIGHLSSTEMAEVTAALALLLGI
jgi:mRNA interferase MazF